MSNYGSRRIEVRRPPVLISFIQIGGGLIILLLGIISIPHNFQIGKDIYQFFGLVMNSNSLSDMWDIILGAYGIATVIYGLVYLPIIIKVIVSGFRLTITGFREILIPWMPANLPAKFKNYKELIKGFKEHSISAYKAMGAFISGLLGQNTMFVSPSRRKTFEDNSKKLQSRIKSIIFKIVILVSIFIVFALLLNNTDSDFAREIISEVGQGIWAAISSTEIRNQLIRPLIYLIILEIILGITEFISLLFLVPRNPPETVAHEGSKHFRGFGHPTQLFTRIPDLSNPLKFEDYDNRVITYWNEDSMRSVGDTGEFKGSLIIEKQPIPEETKGDASGFLLLGVGWLLQIVGYFVILFQVLPEQLKNSSDSLSQLPFIYAPLFVIFMSIFASRTFKNGVRFVDQGRAIFMGCQFRSIAILIEIIGNLSRADVRVGKSETDSIESSNVVVRSDFTARFWAAELISEASPLDKERDLLAMNRVDESKQWCDFFSKTIEDLREEGVRPVGVDLTAPEVEDIVRANIGVSALRAGSIKRAEKNVLEYDEDYPLFNKPAKIPKIESGDNDKNRTIDINKPVIGDEYKECPDCAELVRARARKCRFCGYVFDE